MRAPLVSALQHWSLGAQPIRTQPNTTDYEWAGDSLRRLFKTSQPVAESWPFFSGASKPAVIAQTHPEASVITLAQLTARAPEVLGPAGSDPRHGSQKYFFVKLLDPSDFPPFAYVGINPAAAARVPHPGRRGTTPAVLRGYLTTLFWQDRQALEALAGLMRPRVQSEKTFARLKRAYKTWAIAQARVDWAGRSRMAIAPFVARTDVDHAAALLRYQQAVRRQLAGVLHRIDFEDDQAILIESPTLHAIAGLSLQIHPRSRTNFHPKDELWIYSPLSDAKGRRLGWVLVEPQRTFDKTESCADFFTPFAWRDGRLGFRKAMTRAYLRRFAGLMDVTPRPKRTYVRTTRPMIPTGSRTRGAAQWFRVVEEPGWPYFLVRELRFGAAGESRTPFSHESFVELHATQGTIDVVANRSEREGCRVRVTPERPVFLPASLPYDELTFRAVAPARLYFVTRR